MNSDKISFSGKKITVMGLGVHGGGLGNVKWLSEQGARVTVTDLRGEDELGLQLQEIRKIKNVEVVLGEHRQEDFVSADIVIRNPAVLRTSKYLQFAREAGAIIEMDSSLFFKLVGKENIIGVTGSKGKTTTVSAIARILSVKKVGVEGGSPLEMINKNWHTSSPKDNVDYFQRIISPAAQSSGPAKGYDQAQIPPRSLLDKKVRQSKNEEVVVKKVVFELSSWRLEALDDQQISPAIAIITSIYKDHLNTYKSFSEYKDIKKSIIRYQNKSDLAILNVDDSLLRQWEKEIQGNFLGYSIGDRGCNGIFIRDGYVNVRIDGKEDIVLPEEDLPLKHVHEKRNILPGILLAVIEGVNIEEIKRRVREIVPLPHRMEEVQILDDVRFINDSAATMPDATIVALQALSQENIIHIVGGNDKELNWKEWAIAEVNANIKEMIWLPGNATEKMRQDYMREGGQVKGIEVNSMQQAVELAAQEANRGDVVLLSPAATSFGLFKNEFDRGNAFTKCVEGLQKTARDS